MMVRLIVKFHGYHENNKKTDERYEILNFFNEEEITMDKIRDRLEKISDFSPYRTKTDIDILELKPF